MTSTRTALAVLLAVAMTLSVTAARAGVIFTIEEIGGDVLITGSGSYDLTGATLVGIGNQDGFINSSNGLAVGGPAGFVDLYRLSLNPGAPGTGVFVNGMPDTGDRFGLDTQSLGGFITVPDGYVSGTALAGTTRFSGQSLFSLGLSAGTIVYGIPNDTLTLHIIPEPAAVPEPAILALLGLGLVATGWMRRRRDPRA